MLIFAVVSLFFDVRLGLAELGALCLLVIYALIDLSPVKALYLSAEQVTAETLGSISAQLSSIGANALVLEMKGTQGTLGWYSSVPLASSYGTNGTLDIASAVAPLKEEGIWLVARISCCIDEYMAIRNAPLALATAAGTVYSDTAGIWLDPSNTDVRQYTADLAAELLSLGFDEVLLSDLYVPQPTDGTELVFSQVGSVELTPDIIMSGYALTVRDAVEAAGGKLSVVCDANAWRGGTTDSNGQDRSRPRLRSRPSWGPCRRSVPVPARRSLDKRRPARIRYSAAIRRTEL